VNPGIAIPLIDLRGKTLTKAQYKRAIPRAGLDVAHAMVAIEPILERVKSGNEDTLRSLAQEFDGVKPEQIRVPRAVIDQALADLDPAVRIALETSIGRVRTVHEEQARQTKIVEVVPGATISQRWIPVDRVGLYVPGGKAVYPSSVMMNVVPAQIARVPSIAVASPPQREYDGLPHPTILATCALLGIYEVYAVGGAQAVAMFAYGVEGVCDPVDLVTGPGNIYVAAAKRALRGLIAIDSEAGPTEIGVLADETAIAGEVAADLISQAEHDVSAAAVLVTNSEALAAEVRIELTKRVPLTRHSERITAALTGVQSAIVMVDSMEQGIAVMNGYAAEHLELHVREVEAVASEIRNAGAVFMGRYSPVSLGDYSAGSNHVLPTGGCACHSSGLSVQTFLKGVNFISYDEASFTDIAATVITLANAEDLPAHGEAMSARFEEKS
jgi:histidinol dehydrogenase